MIPSDLPAPPEKTYLQGVFATILTPIFLIGWFVPMIWLRAWVTMKLWNWYIVPQFHLSRLSMIWAFGLALTVTFLAVGEYNGPDERPKALKVLSMFGLRAWVTLLVGWIGTFFI